MAISEAMYLLPQVFQYIQVIGYIVMAMFFGSIAMRGWKGYLPWYMNLAARFGVGFICLFVGISIGPLITALRTGMLSIFQLDLITVGVISSIMISVALYLISSKSRAAVVSLRKHLEKTQEKITKLGHPPKGMTTEKWIGVAIIIALVAIAAISFKGFPENPTAEIFRSMGLPEDVATMSPDCLGAIMAMSSMGDIRDPPLYEDESIKSIVEEKSGKTVFEMYRLDSNGQTIIAVKTADDKTCFATETEFCMCQE